MSADGKPVSVAFRHMASIGGTPFRLGPGMWNSDGIGNTGGLVQLTDQTILIRTFVRFKLSVLGQVAARLATRHWPPNATMMIDYKLRPQYKSAQVQFRGTSVPSVRSYLDWKLTDDHRLEDLDWESFQAFITSKGCQDAIEERTATREIWLSESDI